MADSRDDEYPLPKDPNLIPNGFRADLFKGWAIPGSVQLGPGGYRSTWGEAIQSEYANWTEVVKSARGALVEQGFKSPSSMQVWSLLCQVSNAAFVDDRDFFEKVMEQQFYPQNTTHEILQKQMITNTIEMQIMLNACTTGVGDTDDRWYTSVNGGAATHLDDSDIAKITSSRKKDWPIPVEDGHEMLQSQEDVDGKVATASALQIGRLRRNHVGMLGRPKHALFVEEHVATHDCVVNDPNKSSLQAITGILCEPYIDTLESVTDVPGVDEGFCQTWSLFELECNIMACAGVHEQLRSNYIKIQKDPSLLFNPTHTADANAAQALETAVLRKYSKLDRSSVQLLALAVLQDKLCRRFAHIFGYNKYPTAVGSKWPPLDLPYTFNRRCVPVTYAVGRSEGCTPEPGPATSACYPKNPYPVPADASDASFTSILAKYREDNNLTSPIYGAEERGVNRDGGEAKMAEIMTASQSRAEQDRFNLGIQRQIDRKMSEVKRLDAAKRSGSDTASTTHNTAVEKEREKVFTEIKHLRTEKIRIPSTVNLQGLSLVKDLRKRADTLKSRTERAVARVDELKTSAVPGGSAPKAHYITPSVANDDISLFVRSLSFREEPLFITVPRNSTMKTVKEIVCRNRKIPVESQKIILEGGKQVDDAVALSELGNDVRDTLFIRVIGAPSRKHDAIPIPEAGGDPHNIRSAVPTHTRMFANDPGNLRSAFQRGGRKIVGPDDQTAKKVTAPADMQSFKVGDLVSSLDFGMDGKVEAIPNPGDDGDPNILMVLFNDTCTAAPVLRKFLQHGSLSGTATGGRKFNVGDRVQLKKMDVESGAGGITKTGTIKEILYAVEIDREYIHLNGQSVEIADKDAIDHI